MQTHFPATAWKYVTVVKGPGLDTKGSLISFINRPDVAADLLVVGMVGRKGPKSEPTLIGRTSDYALREAHMSSCVCKLHELPKESLFAIAVDGSDRAHLGVSLVEHLARPTDRVIVVHVEVRSATIRQMQCSKHPLAPAHYRTTPPRPSLLRT